ncbi:hypothetical protein [Nonomuraea sp. NEAU-A123]|uniref:hypothetical protein n=1 Tax=Nonomuraea sp. NEAU-A123 TaxID=2839649 RepID=UPI001BE3DE69|nr:hypothetical protein [Nonomuraea sp. NEAU-A123]MBT2235652.1 hypothetical protein [Nonomuraea sp. NEAU-A123]
MDIRNDHERRDDRPDESADVPPLRPVPVPAVEHDSADDVPPTTPSDKLVFDRPAHPPPATPAPAVSLLDSDPAGVQDRWRDLQTSFVDDPRDAVQRADSLLDEVMASVHQALESRIRELQDRWKNSGHNDTEQLRMALRSYRDILHRLLPLAAAHDHDHDDDATR